MKRTKYIVYAGDDVARFSDEVHARVFAVTQSKRMPGFLLEISEKSGLIGQYQNGEPTDEFKTHHKLAFIV